MTELEFLQYLEGKAKLDSRCQELACFYQKYSKNDRYNYEGYVIEDKQLTVQFECHHHGDTDYDYFSCPVSFLWSETMGEDVKEEWERQVAEWHAQQERIRQEQFKKAEDQERVELIRLKKKYESA